MKGLFYRPEAGFVGDVIPWFEDGVYYLYFLYAHRNPDRFGEGTSWYLVTTEDFVDYREYGEVLRHGTKEEQDLNAYTGSVYKENGVYYLYYTGYNAYPPYRVQEEPLQAVMLAKSSDLFHWEKLPAKTFYASEAQYELSDWRDPYVFRNEERKEYWMLLAARLRQGPKRRRGCVGLCRSADLENWTAAEPLFAPGLYMTHECPELFQMGKWWYLVYSSFSERFATHYRMAESPEGPFLVPQEDTFDGRGFYAGKTASDGKRRFLFGWIPTRKNKNDYGEYEWAGNLIVHELIQQADGTLAAVLPQTVKDAFTQELSLCPGRTLGNCTMRETKKADTGILTEADAASSFAAAVYDADLPVQCMMTARFRFRKGTKALGIMLRTDGEFDTGYFIRFEPPMNRMVFDMWPRKIKKEEEDTWEIKGDSPFFAELERKCLLEAEKEYQVEILVEDTACAVYFDGQTVMSARIYNIKKGRPGFFVSEGQGEFYDVHVKIRGKEKGYGK